MSDTSTDQKNESTPAAKAEAKTDAPAGPKAPKVPLPAETTHTTRWTTDVTGEALTYDATVGTLHVETKKVKPGASVFYAAYTLLPDGTHPDTTRPVTFIFNGGPGSATTYLLLGSIAPQRIVTRDAAPVQTAPYELIDNPQTLLPETDLVFIDAPGAGFSTIAEEAKAELWSVDGDVAGFVTFIEHYLTRTKRWNSPKYVLGESYGTTRGAALSYALLDKGIALNGLVLLSSILDYGHIVATHDQGYIGFFPTYAAISRYHGRAGDGSIADHAQKARAFADGELRRALSRGASLDEADQKAAAAHYAELTGLDATYVDRSELRVVDHRFRKELLREDNKVVGRYDGRVSGYDMDQAGEGETFVVDDAFINPGYASLVNSYLRDTLGWTGDSERLGFAEFDWSSTEPGKGWVWKHKPPYGAKSLWGDEYGFPLVLPDLAAAIVQNTSMKVLAANGYFDLATPFFQTEYDIDHLGLPAQLRDNIAFTYYEAGHMVYTSEPQLEKFAGDLRRFYAADVSELKELNERPALP